MFCGHLDCFHKPPLGGRPNTKRGDHSTPNAHNRLLADFITCEGPTRIETHWNSIWLRTRDHIIWFLKCLWTLLLGFHNFMVTTSWLVCGSDPHKGQVFFWVLDGPWEVPPYAIIPSHQKGLRWTVSSCRKLLYNVAIIQRTRVSHGWCLHCEVK